MSRIAWLMLIACCGTSAARAEIPFAATVVRDAEGGVIRGDVETKRLALIFTGDKFGESATPILDALAERSVKYLNAWSNAPVCAPAPAAAPPRNAGA